ncbi:MAG: hypothetical protein Q4P33_02750 [Flaviflexus sp.]|nr:hypothetical protein [Flaviflexus sp.]
MNTSQLHTIRRILQMVGALSVFASAWMIKNDGTLPAPFLIFVGLIIIVFIVVAKMIERAEYSDLSAPQINIKIPEYLAERQRLHEDPPASSPPTGSPDGP